MPAASFSSLDLRPELLRGLEALGFSAMTEIQARSLPAILAGTDVIGQAKTGSGKTAAFGLGLLNALDPTHFAVQALVLCPTRELADQVAEEIRALARAIDNVKVLTLCGGSPMRDQISSLAHGAHIVVGTPGRIEAHLRKDNLQLGEVQQFVLDEADRMLDMGFEEAVDAIAHHLPPPDDDGVATWQTLMFSATYPLAIAAMAARFMADPVRVEVAAVHDDTTIRQHFYRLTGERERLPALRLLLLDKQHASAIVFCRTKRDVDAVTEQLGAWGFSVTALHGDMEQRQRDQALLRFANDSVCLLVATDVAARGLDIDDVDAVFNYQVALDAEVHVHRIGRTGRAGSTGIAYSLYTEDEAHRVALLETEVDPITQAEPLPPLSVLDRQVPAAAMCTLQIDGGKKRKVRKGDVLGALTGTADGLPPVSGDEVGKIQVLDAVTYVAVKRDASRRALAKLSKGKIKGRSFRARPIG